MDDIVFRQRYPRYGVQQNPRKSRRSSRRRRENEDRLNLVQKIVVQTVICALILLVAAAIKNIDSPVTNYCKGKIKGMLSYNVDIKSVFGQIDSFLENAMNDRTGTNEDSIIGEGNNKSNVEDSPVLEDEGEEYGTYVKSAQSILTDDEAESKTSSRDETDSGSHDSDNSFIIPVGGIIGALYGERVYTNEGTEEFHQGIDIKALKGTPIKAAAKGEAIEVGENETYGKYIKIKHGEDIISLYANCSDILASKGQSVNKGETIAKVGNTGDSQEPHLHFEVWENGSPVNPLEFIQSPSN
ncbi:M23 family metallopeptidase [Acetivibrio straminisolvens]|nr:M23 family metallopeptidase [Acetivibrio straminisolvens]